MAMTKVSLPLAVRELNGPPLAATLDAEEVSRRLDLLAISCSGIGGLKEVRTSVIKRHSGSHASFEISLATPAGLRSLIGKVYSRDHSGVFKAMETIWLAGLHGEREFSIPRPIAYLRSLDILLQEKIEGVMAADAFVNKDARVRSAIAERCALWLAQFQDLAPPQGRAMTVQRVLELSDHRLLGIVEAGAPCSKKARELFEHLLLASASLEETRLCASHGDFIHHQVMISGERLVVFDWDLYAAADPLYDVARLYVSLERLALREFGTIHALDGAAHTFLNTYLAASRAKVAKNLDFYKALVYLQAAKFDVTTSRAPGSLERADIMLDLGLRSLEM